MSQCLLHLAADFRVDNILVPWKELISSDTLLNELAHALSRCGWPSRTFEEIRKELLRLHGRYLKCGRYLKLGAKHTYLWSASSFGFCIVKGQELCIGEGQEFFIVEGQEFCIVERQEFFIVEGQEVFIIEGQKLCINEG